jgi:hypothetical protein
MAKHRYWRKNEFLGAERDCKAMPKAKWRRVVVGIPQVKRKVCACAVPVMATLHHCWPAVTPTDLVINVMVG